MQLQDLPDEILADIAAKLSVKEIFSWRLANKYFDTRIEGFLGQIAMQLEPSKTINAGRLALLCHTFTGAVKLDMCNCNDSTLHGDVLLNLPKGLKRLDLDGCNWLTEEGCACLARLQNLENLYIFESGALALLPICLTLKKLERLWTTPIFAEPERLCDFTRLSNLCICLNSTFSGFPESFTSLKNLKEVRVDRCSSFESMSSICDLPSLDSLSIEACPISEVPESISQLSSLTYLDISKTNIAVLPDSIGNLRFLKELFLSENPGMYDIPDGVSRLQALEALNVADCTMLEWLPAGLIGLKKLTSINVSGCPNVENVSCNGCVITLKNDSE